MNLTKSNFDNHSENISINLTTKQISKSKNLSQNLIKKTWNSYLIMVPWLTLLTYPMSGSSDLTRRVVQGNTPDISTSSSTPWISEFYEKYFFYFLQQLQHTLIGRRQTKDLSTANPYQFSFDIPIRT